MGECVEAGFSIERTADQLIRQIAMHRYPGDRGDAEPGHLAVERGDEELANAFRSAADNHYAVAHQRGDCIPIHHVRDADASKWFRPAMIIEQDLVTPVIEPHIRPLRGIQAAYQGFAEAQAIT